MSPPGAGGGRSGEWPGRDVAQRGRPSVLRHPRWLLGRSLQHVAGEGDAVETQGSCRGELVGQPHQILMDQLHAALPPARVPSRLASKSQGDFRYL